MNMHGENYGRLMSTYLKHNFLLPAYGKQSIAEVMPTIVEKLGGRSSRPKLDSNYFPEQPIDNIMMLIVDGLGYDYYEHLAKHSEFFKRILDNDRLAPLTSVFPSTTPAALTTLYSGLTPQEHGLLEWYTYFEEFQRIIMPMQFRVSWEDEVNSLVNDGGKPSHLYQHVTAYQLLQDANVESYIITPSRFVPSIYNDAVMHRAIIKTYDTMEQMFSLGKELVGEKHNSLISLYWGDIDSTGHKYGPGSAEYLYQIEVLAKAFDQYFATADQDQGPHLFMMISDHGQIPVNLEKLTYLEDIFDFNKYLYVNQRQEIIVPYGSPNDVFLLTNPHRTEELMEILRADLSGIAEVWFTRDLLSMKYFGLYEPTEIFSRRVGSVCIIPYPGHHVWFEYAGSKEYSQKGLHGGLSRSEMLVPLAVSTIN